MTLLNKFINHNSHGGFIKTMKRICANLYWKGMRQRLKKFIRECDTCQCRKVENLGPAGLLPPLPIPDQVWDDISMDL